MKYKYSLKLVGDNPVTHIQYGDADYQMKVSPGYGYLHAGWYTEDSYLGLGFPVEEVLEEKTVIDQVYQELDLPVFEDIPGELTAEEQEASFRENNETLIVDEIEKYVIPEISHQEYRFDANYEIIVENDFSEEIAAVHKPMSDTIANAGLATFGVPDEPTQISFAIGWQLKVARPEDFVSESLVAFKEVAGFSLGDPLDDATKIQTFYSALVDQTVEWVKVQDRAINTYLAAKAAIEA